MRLLLPRLTITSLLALGAALCSSACFAGRPLTVDDANVNDVGAGHVEAWYARAAGAANTWTVAPAYGLVEGVEVSAALARDSSSQLTASALQAKFRLTASRKDGCNFGAVVGLAHVSDGGGNAPYLNGIFTCNQEDGAVHLNLGAVRPSGGSTQRTWGVAYERDLGAFTPHIEYFGQQSSAPTLQAGLRSDVAKNIQLDATVGRSAGESLYSLGMKFMF